MPNVNFTVVYVPAGSDCSATPISNSAVTLANVVGDVRNTLVVQQTSTFGFNQTAADTTGKDNVFVLQNGQSTQFVGPDGGTTALAFRDVTLLDPGLTRTMTASPSGATRPYRTAAGRVTMLATNAGILLCDDSVVNGHLVKCDLDVRKP